MNSVNLLDGIDGLATMLGIILIATFAALAAAAGRMEVAWIAMVFAGSLCGFIRFNLPPASIFLGDSGSMLIGLVVGTLAIQGTLKGPGTVLLAAPLAVWTIPILDSAAAILRRKLTGRSIYATDRGHLHHRLLERLGSNSRVLVAVAVCLRDHVGGGRDQRVHAQRLLRAGRLHGRDRGIGSDRALRPRRIRPDLRPGEEAVSGPNPREGRDGQGLHAIAGHAAMGRALGDGH